MDKKCEIFMTISRFRERHSYLIEQYQYIEMHLEGIYASICSKTFQSGLDDVEKTNLYKLLLEIERIEKERNQIILPEEDRIILKEIINRRNYWVHDCYIKILIDDKADRIKRQADIDDLENDIRSAESECQRLFELKRKYMKIS